MPRFAGPDTFARLPRLADVGSAAVAVLGIPFDAGVSYRPGARFGPAAVRAGAKLLRPHNPALGVDPWARQQVADAGDLAVNPFDIAAAIAEIESGARVTLAAADRLIALGGDHTVALPLLRATAARHGPVALVHFDAHLDTWDTYFGAPYTHGTPFRRAAEEGLLALGHSVHVGVRGPLYSAADLTDDAGLGFSIVSTEDVARRGVDEAVGRIRERAGDHPVYLSVDIDVLDPAHAPGTGTPEPGGLTTRELQLILRGLAGLRLAGADVVEVSPPYDHAELTSLAAANVAYEMLSLFALGRLTVTIVAVCQVRLAVADPEGNLAAAAAAVGQAAAAGAGLVVLPELCDSGYVFSSAAEAAGLASPAGDSAALRQWQALARAHSTVIVGGFCELGGDGRLYNSAALVDASGVRAVYRKAHLWDAEKAGLHARQRRRRRWSGSRPGGSPS